MQFAFNNVKNKQYRFYVDIILIWIVFKDGLKIHVHFADIINNHQLLNFAKNVIIVKAYGSA